ncbi:MBL fold metallo-hydrolase [Candidatus Woesebacteria bacterium]|nr:MBL fold metallo-hydrolase [Candidatus Woesebacteria bacterium]
MTITYHGHSCFKLRGRRGTVVTDPYDAAVGLTLPSLTADMVTVSHDHYDHNASSKVKGTARRERPFVIDKPGEYEVGGISIFGVPSFHDANKGVERGPNSIFTILLDDLRICHLGDLGHEVDAQLQEDIGSVDILLIPVGGVYTINPEKAVKVIRSLEPSIVIPMHYKTPGHDEKVFAEVATLEQFLKEYGVEVAAVPKLDIEKADLPEETTVVVLQQT